MATPASSVSPILVFTCMVPSLVLVKRGTLAQVNEPSNRKTLGSYCRLPFSWSNAAMYTPLPQRGHYRTHTLQQSASYSITSSARSKNDSGIVSPTASAARRLTISSNLVGACIGRSAGFAAASSRPRSSARCRRLGAPSGHARSPGAASSASGPLTPRCSRSEQSDERIQQEGEDRAGH